MKTHLMGPSVQQKTFTFLTFYSQIILDKTNLPFSLLTEKCTLTWKCHIPSTHSFNKTLFFSHVLHNVLQYYLSGLMHLYIYNVWLFLKISNLYIQTKDNSLCFCLEFIFSFAYLGSGLAIFLKTLSSFPHT